MTTTDQVGVLPSRLDSPTLRDMASPRRRPRTGKPDLQTNVSRVIKILMALRDVDQQTLAAETGMLQSSLSNRFSGTRRWQLEDLAVLSEYFDVPASTFVQSADELVAVGGRPDPDGGGVPSLADRRARRSTGDITPATDREHPLYLLPRAS